MRGDLPQQAIELGGPEVRDHAKGGQVHVEGASADGTEALPEVVHQVIRQMIARAKVDAGVLGQRRAGQLTDQAVATAKVEQPAAAGIREQPGDDSREEPRLELLPHGVVSLRGVGHLLRFHPANLDRRGRDQKIWDAFVMKPKPRSCPIPGVPRSPVAAIACTLAVLLLAGCGGSENGLSPAAEPAVSPPLEQRPAGRVIPIGNKPEGLVADARTRLLAVGLTNPDLLALVDMDTLEVVRWIPMPESPRHLRLAASGGPVLVPAERSDQLIEVFLPGGRLRRTGVGDFPHDAASDGRGRVFVGDEGGDTLSVIENGRRVQRLSAPVQPGGVVTSDDGGLVAVVGVSERALELFDTRTLRRLGKIDAGVGPTHVVSRGNRFFVVDTRGDGLLEVLTEPDLRIHRRTPLPGTPYGVTVDPVRKRFWVTLTETNQVVELTDRRPLRTYPTVRQPNTVAVDSMTGRVFVASRKDGTLQIIDPPPSGDG